MPMTVTPRPATASRAPGRASRAAGRGLRPKLRIWLLLGETAKIGAGRAELLAAIEDLGSIKAAAERFGMSYRYVWGYLRELEDAAGFPLVERHRGGGGTRGANLTAQGKQLLVRYREFQRRLEAAAEREFAAVFRQA
jgi:molybdate transport system regulatory protein